MKSCCDLVGDHFFLSSGNFDDKTLRDILGEPILKRKEIRNNLSEEELQNGDFLQATIYCESKDEFIIVKQSPDVNFWLTMSWLIINILLDLFISNSIKENSDFDYMDYIDKINKKYQIDNIEELKKILEIKKSNFDRLMR